MASDGDKGLMTGEINAIPLLSISLNDDSRNFLGRLIRSIDYPIDEVCIQIGNADPLIRTDLVSKIQVAKLDKPNLNIKMTVVDDNPGSAVGFNFGLRNMMLKNDVDHFDWVLIVNSDIAFYPGILRKIAGSMQHFIKAHSTFGIGFTSLCCGGEWSAIGITRRLVNKIGYFDENIYPAYYEYITRVCTQLNSIILLVCMDLSTEAKTMKAAYFRICMLPKIGTIHHNRIGEKCMS